MENNTLDIIEKLIREDIEGLEKDKNKLQNRLDKLIVSYKVNDLEKVTSLSQDIKEIYHTINHLYAFIGSLSRRI